MKYESTISYEYCMSLLVFRGVELKRAYSVGPVWHQLAFARPRTVHVVVGYIAGVQRRRMSVLVDECQGVQTTSNQALERLSPSGVTSRRHVCSLAVT